MAEMQLLTRGAIHPMFLIWGLASRFPSQTRGGHWCPGPVCLSKMALVNCKQLLQAWSKAWMDMDRSAAQ